MRTIGRVLIVVGLASGSFAGGRWLAREAYHPPAVDDSRAARAFRASLETIRSNHIESPGRHELYGSATKGLLASLKDPYAEFLTDDAYRRYNERMSGTRLGLRLQLRPQIGGAAAGSALRSLRADAGIDPRDVILAVNGVSTSGWTPADVNVVTGDTRTFAWGTGTPCLRDKAMHSSSSA